MSASEQDGVWEDARRMSWTTLLKQHPVTPPPPPSRRSPGGKMRPNEEACGDEVEVVKHATAAVLDRAIVFSVLGEDAVLETEGVVPQGGAGAGAQGMVCSDEAQGSSTNLQRVRVFAGGANMLSSAILPHGAPPLSFGGDVRWAGEPGLLDGSMPLNGEEKGGSHARPFSGVDGSRPHARLQEEEEPFGPPRLEHRSNTASFGSVPGQDATDFFAKLARGPGRAAPKEPPPQLTVEVSDDADAGGAPPVGDMTSLDVRMQNHRGHSAPPPQGRPPGMHGSGEEPSSSPPRDRACGLSPIETPVRRPSSGPAVVHRDLPSTAGSERGSGLNAGALSERMSAESPWQGRQEERQLVAPPALLSDDKDLSASPRRLITPSPRGAARTR